jgi:(p)ppGpp synthase/HD superfamily hydrolase
VIDVTHTPTGLFKRLVDAGYRDEDLALAHRAYGLAQRLVSSLYNGDGRPFLAHLVGLASLLHRYGRPPEVVAAGLLHSIYAHGDFGVLCSFRRARARVRAEVGDQVEALVHRFHLLPWNWKAPRMHLEDLVDIDAVGREVLIMRLANEVDHLLDGAALHRMRADGYLKARADRMPAFVALALALDAPQLADDLETSLRDARAARIPPFFRNRTSEPFRVLSTSYRQRLLAQSIATLSAALPQTKLVTTLRQRWWPPRG